MNQYYSYSLILCTALILLNGCATLTKSSKAEIRIDSYPQNAQILINGLNHGATPTVANIERKSNHNITFLLRGYRPVNIQVTPKFDAATTILGNLVSWNVIGVVVDVVTGSAYTLTPADLKPHFDQVAQFLDVSTSGSELKVFLITEDQWKQIQRDRSLNND